MNKIFYIGIAALMLSFTACRKYVEIPAELVRELKYTSDYQALLYNSTQMDPAYIHPFFASDDIGVDTLTWQNSLTIVQGNAYTWAEKLIIDDSEDADWMNLYRQIYLCNQIIAEVMTSERGTDLQKRAAVASALVHRAFGYYTLVNMYAKQYDAATAATDPGVPLRLDNKLFEGLERVSVQTIYNQIITDLNAALPDLTPLPDFNSNPSKAAAFSILARTYLNMRNFPEASRFADSTLNIQNTLLDLNLYATSLAGFPTKLKDPEIIFFKRTSLTPTTIPLSASMISLLDAKDLRYQVLTVDGINYAPVQYKTRGYYRPRFTNEGVYVGPNVPEIMLIKAECEARANRPANAIALLNTLRKKRFRPADYTDLSATTGDAAMAAVVRERRVELMGRGFRWFDQRRLAKDAGYIQTVTRNFKGATYTLEPGSPRYVLPIADRYIRLNPEIAQNPR